MSHDHSPMVNVDRQAEAFWTWFDGAEAADVNSENIPNSHRWNEIDRKIPGVAITGSGRRKTPRMARRRGILALQKNRCLYCEHEFGSTVMRKGNPVVLQVNWDHFIPYAYGQTNAYTNWVAACHVCNGIKSARMFDTVMEAQKYILQRWIEKGYVLRSPLALSTGDLDT